MNYRERILKELKAADKPAIYDLMDLCNVPDDKRLMDQFRMDIKSLVCENKVIRVCTKRNRLGEDVVGYYTLG